ncbi:carbohydrate-binding family 9-like protein [Sinomicrobium weinanense]|uniref:Carbohydrate-binding family 9-like protein n=1 Tax=Sinomicrobium weinanense TaxID=2842200 RepID=A0A926Q5H5_9FLAO|nr:carbohydrate-binding family 9-like protein [Sinomicrobium weinanense]MBC9797980.1 carbohydrate-binding family 9-like protein [Sinomicrobium weinanense]MBU3125503.1 carbohydrate-binding family 9-like protein [Sinomicrobium weinanense]
MSYIKPLIILLLCGIASLACEEKKKTKNDITSEAVQTMNENKKETLPELIVNKESFTKIEDLHFKHSVGGEAIKEETLVMVKYDSLFLEIKFECRNNPRMDQNHYTEDNSPMFNQEVFELFISKGKEAREDYLEIQLNPNNALFLARINNQYKGNKEFNLDYIDTKTSGVEHSVAKDRDARTWSGHLRIPLQLLQYPENTPDPVYRLNFYRIISQADHSVKDWSNNPENATYACWSSTMAQRPQFHRPEYFGYLFLK